MSNADRFEMSQKERKRSRSRPAARPSTIDNRPPWNNDTYIEGYEDVDEKGKFRKRGGPLPKSVDQQDNLTKNWTESLREQHHKPQSTANRP